MSCLTDKSDDAIVDAFGDAIIWAKSVFAFSAYFEQVDITLKIPNLHSRLCDVMNASSKDVNPDTSRTMRRLTSTSPSLARRNNNRLMIYSCFEGSEESIARDWVILDSVAVMRSLMALIASGLDLSRLIANFSDLNASSKFPSAFDLAAL